MISPLFYEFIEHSKYRFPTKNSVDIVSLTYLNKINKTYRDNAKFRCEMHECDIIASFVAKKYYIRILYINYDHKKCIHN